MLSCWIVERCHRLFMHTTPSSTLIFDLELADNATNNQRDHRPLLITRRPDYATSKQDGTTHRQNLAYVSIQIYIETWRVRPSCVLPTGPAFDCDRIDDEYATRFAQFRHSIAVEVTRPVQTPSHSEWMHNRCGVACDTRVENFVCWWFGTDDTCRWSVNWMRAVCHNLSLNW